MCFPVCICIPVIKLQPKLPWHFFKGTHPFQDQLAGLVIFSGYPSLDQHTGIFIQKALILFIIPWKNHYFHSTHQILQGNKGHHLIILGIFNGFLGHHTTNYNLLVIHYHGKSRLFIRLKICGLCTNVLFKYTSVLFQGMSAKINPQYIFFKGQDNFLCIFSHIWHTDLISLLIFFTNQVKQAHLPCHAVLLILADMIHYPAINQHFLLPVAWQAVKCPCLDKIFDGAFIHLPAVSFNEITQCTVDSVFPALLHQRFDHRPAHTFNSGKAITDPSLVNRKATFSVINIRRQNLNSHLTAYLNILCHFGWHFDHGGHKRSHKFHRIIIFQISRLISYDCISCRMGFIKSIFCKISHFIIDLICCLLRDPVGNTARHSLLLISIYKVLPLFFHDRSFFLGHCTTHKITSS